jgi:thioester reductase-like protein
VLVEKLLRDTHTGPIFLLLRAPALSSDTSVQNRLLTLVQSTVFDRLRQDLGVVNFQKRVSRLVVVLGDVVAPQCGLSDADAMRVCGAVRVVLHCAGSTDFNEVSFRHLRTNSFCILRVHFLQLIIF